MQEFRDRCARAMGLELKEGNWWGTRPGYGSPWPMYRRDLPVTSIPFWAPDEDFNQAMQMREKATAKAGRFKFALCLGGETCVGHEDTLDAENNAHASARQIAEAALKVLEDK